MEREEEAVMLAVLNSLVEEQPFHSSSVIDPQTECSSSSSPPLMANLGFFLLKLLKQTKKESVNVLFRCWAFGLSWASIATEEMFGLVF